jgi:hypothetical protein
LLANTDSFPEHCQGVGADSLLIGERAFFREAK